MVKPGKSPGFSPVIPLISNAMDIEVVHATSEQAQIFSSSDNDPLHISQFEGGRVLGSNYYRKASSQAWLWSVDTSEME